MRTIHTIHDKVALEMLVPQIFIFVLLNWLTLKSELVFSVILSDEQPNPLLFARLEHQRGNEKHLLQDWQASGTLDLGKLMNEIKKGSSYQRRNAKHEVTVDDPILLRVQQDIVYLLLPLFPD